MRVKIYLVGGAVVESTIDGYEKLRDLTATLSREPVGYLQLGEKVGVNKGQIMYLEQIDPPSGK